MVLFTAIIFVVAIVLAYFADEKWYADGILIISTVVAVFAGFAFVGCGITSIYIYSSADATYESYQAERKSLVYQLENDLYDNDNDLGKKELYDQITEYNKNVTKGREYHNRLMTQCFYPDIYDDLELIDFDKEIEETN